MSRFQASGCELMTSPKTNPVKRLFHRYMTSLLRPPFHRYARWHLKELLDPAYPVILEYSIRPAPRYGEGKPAHPEIASILACNDHVYRETLIEISAFSDNMAQISERVGKPGECYWENDYFSAMDAVALYGILGWKKPTRYVEVGSGNSTLFAHRAILDLHLRTRIISIDPSPRAEVDALCDRVIRQPLEDVNASIFEELEAGDVLFVDSSHRVFQNSDVTVFFLEILPRLKRGILIHIHDIFLPFDYPSDWSDRHYSEQYLLAAYLLAGHNTVEVLLPQAYLSQHHAIGKVVDEAWAQPALQRSFSRQRLLTGGYNGTSFWLGLK